MPTDWSPAQPAPSEGPSPAGPTASSVRADDSPPTLVLRRLARSEPTPPDTPASQPPPSSGPPVTPDTPHGAQATQLDIQWPVVPGYEVLQEIGRGGMGVVYRARQLGLDRVVALKMLHAGAAGPAGSLARFRSEAEAIGRLQHPNIIAVHEVGTCPAGPYFVLEHVGGGSLASRLGGAPQPAATAARLVRALARAAHAAHQRGVVHRDLKPANILLVEGSDTPLDQCTPKIGDFGLARRLDEASGLTLSGQVMGTPGYMPPEQASGPSDAVGPASDVYSLGAILYELLVGAPPFRGSTALESFHQLVSLEPVPPSRLVAGCPRDLEVVCLQCLNKDPARRYASAADLADDLDRFLNRQPVRARPTPAWERGWKWARRRPGTAGLSACLLGLLVVGFALVTSLWLHAEALQAHSLQERDRAVTLAQAEARARAESQRLSARLLLEHGMGLCERGEVGPGLLWLVRALEAVPTEDEPLERSLRLLLGGWGRQLHTLGARHLYPGKARAVLFDGERVAVACDDQVHFWDSARRAPAGAPLKLPGKVVQLLRDTEGMMAVVRVPSGLSLHRLPLGKPLGSTARLSPPVRGARCLALGGDGLALLGCDDGTACLFRVRDGQMIGQPLGHPAAVGAVALSRDGKWALTGCADRVARLWSLADGKLVRALKHHVAPVSAAAFSPDGAMVVTGGHDHRVCLWQRDTGALLNCTRHQHAVRVVAFHPEGRLFATSGDDHTARLWSVESAGIADVPLRHNEDVPGLAFSPDGRRLATVSADGCLRLWRLNLPTISDRVLRHPAAVLALAHSPRERLVLTACADGFVRLWRPATGAVRARYLHATAHCVAFHPSGHVYLVGLWTGALGLYETAGDRPVREPLPHAAPVLCAAFSPDGRRLATGCEDGDRVVRIWDWKSGTVQHQLVGHSRKVSALAFSPDGQLLLTASWDYRARLWDTTTGRPVGTPLAHQDLVQSVAFAPDGRTALTAGDDYMARLWNIAPLEACGLPLRHPDKLHAVGISPRGDLVAAGGKGGQVRLWEPMTGKPAGPPLPHAGEVHSLTFSPDGKHLWTGSWDGTARRWDVPAPRRESVEELRRWVEGHTGLRLDSTGAVVTLTLAERGRRVRLLSRE